MHKIPLKFTRSFLTWWQALLLLCIFLLTRGLVPAGFMPAPLASGKLYDFCHVDSSSAQLLGLSKKNTVYGHHQASFQVPHRHDPEAGKGFTDNHCIFSATGATLPPIEIILLFTVDNTAAKVGVLFAAGVFCRAYFQPPGRAPPYISR